MLEVQKINKGFGKPGTHEFHKVLDDLSLRVKQGDAIAIIGPSGCGKSTLLNIIGSLDKPDSGIVNFRGKQLNELSKNELQVYRNQNIGFVFQLHHLFPQCTLFENVLIPALPQKDKSKAQNRAENLIRSMDLWERRNDKPATLSGGELQRTALIRALINEPALLLADEPTGALDEDNANQLIELLLKVNKETGTTLVVVTHSNELASRMQKIYRLSKGKLIEEK